jgi:DNA-binding SARP family transcriptional activator
MSALGDETPIVQVLGRLALGPLGIRSEVRGLGARLLLMLVTAPDDGVDDDLLIGRLWSYSPPTNAAYSLRNQVATLRKRLGHTAIVRTAGGYRLDPSVGTDLAEFDRRVEDGRFAEAFALVRGPAYSEVRTEAWALGAVAAADERLALAADHWGAQRCRNPHEADLAWLREQVEDAPHREIRWEHLITAYAQLDLRADVLRAAHAARRAMAAVGLTVSSRLRNLERSVLLEELQDPSGSVAAIVRPSGPPVRADGDLEAPPTDTTGAVSLARVTEAPGLFIVRAREGRAATDTVLGEIDASAAAAGEQVVYVRAGAATRFLTRIAEGMSRLAGASVDDPWIAALRAGTHTHIPLGDPGIAAASVQRALTNLAVDISATAPLWVIVNDAERLDPANRRFLDRLAGCDDVTVVLAYGLPDEDDDDEDDLDEDRLLTPAQEFVRTAPGLLSAGGAAGAVDAAAAFLDRHAMSARDLDSITACILAASILLTDPAHSAAGVAALDLAERRATELGNPTLLTDVMLARGPIQNTGGNSRRIAARASELAELLPADDYPRQVQLASWAAHHLLLVGERDQALALVDRAEALAAHADLPVLTSLILGMRTNAQLHVGGSPFGSADALARLEAWGALSRCVTAEAAAGLLGMSVHMGADGFATVSRDAERLDRLVDLLPRADLRWAPAAVRVGMVMAALDQTRPDDADDAITDAQRLAASIGLQGGEATAFLQRLVLAHQLGKLAAHQPTLEAFAGQARPVPLMLAAYGLVLVSRGDTDAAREVADRLAATNPLTGGAWPVAAAFAAHLAWRTQHEPLAQMMWRELSPWAGWGLNMGGMVYVGSADTSLGLAAAALGQATTAVELLAQGAVHDRRRGATWWATHATDLATAVRNG